MVDVIFTACLLANHIQCQEIRLSDAFDGDNPWYCSKMAETKAVDFLKEHPEYYIAKFGCIKSKAKEI